jgi:hypothetical protein
LDVTGENVYYTAKLTAGSSALPMEVAVGNGKFTDMAGNPNAHSNAVMVGVIQTAPSVSISAGQTVFSKGNSGDSLSTQLTFNLSTQSSDFTVEDIEVMGGGLLSNFTPSATNDKVYTATLSEITESTTVKVGKDLFVGGSSPVKNSSSNLLTFNVDTLAPTVTIDITTNSSTPVPLTSLNSLKAGETAKVVFTLSELDKGFGVQAIRVSGGFLSDFQKDTSSISTNKWRAVFNLAPGDARSKVNVVPTINVDAGRFTDMVGNGNIAASSDRIDPTVSRVTDATSATKTKDPITFTVTFDEAVVGLVGTSSFTATNGTVTSVAQVGSSNVYTVVVAPTAGVANGNVALSVVGTGLTDAAGNAACGRR